MSSVRAALSGRSSHAAAGTYAIGSDLKPRTVSAGQLLGAIECSPTEPAAPLPVDTNERVMAAYEQYREDYSSRLGRARRPGRDTRDRRYLAKYLRLALEQAEGDLEEQLRIETLRRIFLDHLQGNVQAEIGVVRSMNLEGRALIVRLEALRQRFKLNPPEDGDDGSDADSVEVTRIICSDGIA